MHIKNDFESENIKDQHSDQKIISYGNDFINKTFYLVYHVSPPILSGWKKYFIDKWKEAFGENEIPDDSVIQIYDLLTKEQTPRKILAFINDFVSIKQIADEKILDKYIALFIIGKEYIVENPLTEIITPSYLSSLEFMYKNDSKMQESISALYYQLPLENAIDIVFTKRFSDELNSNQVDSLRTMKGNDKYWDILYRSIISVVNIENATTALDKTFNGDKSDKIQKLWNALSNKFDLNISSIENYEIHNKILLSNTENKQYFFDRMI